MPSAVFTPAAAAYGAGDIIEGAKSFDFGAMLGGLCEIKSATLLISHTAVISGETTYRLHLYNVTPPSALADNAAWDLPAGDRASYLGYVDFAQVVDLGSSVFIATDDINKVINVSSSVSGGLVYAYLQTIGAFTATAAARTVTLNVKPLSME